MRILIVVVLFHLMGALSSSAQLRDDVRWARFGVGRGGQDAVSLTVSDDPPAIYTTGGNACQKWPLKVGEWPIRSADLHWLGGPSPIKMPKGDTEMIFTTGDSIEAWNPVSNSIRRICVQLPSSSCSIDISPDGSLIAFSTFADTTVTLQLINRFTGEEIWRLKNAGMPARFSPDGNLLLTNVDFNVVLLDVKTHAILHQYTEFRSFGFSFAWSPVRPGVFAFCHSHGDAVMDTSGAVITSLPFSGNSLDFSPDGTLIAGETVGGLDVFRVADNQNTYILSPSTPWEFAFLNNDTIVGIGVSDVSLYSASKGILIEELFSGLTGSLSFSGDGKKLITGTGLWNAASGMPSNGTPLYCDMFSSLACSFDGSIVVAGGSNGEIWLKPNPLSDSILTIRKRITDTSVFPSIAFSPTESVFAVSHRFNFSWPYRDQRNSVQLWSAITHNVLRVLDTRQEPVFDVAFSHDGSMIAATTFIGTYVWDVHTGHLLDTSQSSGYSVSFFPGDTSILICDNDVIVHRLYSESETPIENPAFNFNRAVILPGGRKIAAIQTDGVDSGIQIIDISTGAIARTIKTPDNTVVLCLAVNPVTGDIATGGQDLVVWKSIDSTPSGVRSLPIADVSSLDVGVTRGVLDIELPESTSHTCRIYIYRIDGRCVFSSNVKQPSVTTSPLSDGVYFVMLVDERGVRMAEKKVSVF